MSSPRCLAAITLLTGTLLSGCELLTSSEDRNSIEYGVGALEVFDQTFDWSGGPVTYLRASLFAVNREDNPVELSMPGCILPVEATPAPYAGPGAEPVWRSPYRGDWPDSRQYSCFGDFDEELGPGDTLWDVGKPIPLAEILADSLPAGAYHFRVRLMSEVSSATASHHEARLVEMGDVFLPESRYPLSLDGYPRDGFYYRVSVSPPASGDGPSTAGLEVSIWHDQALTRHFSANCPVRLLAYASPADRETIPVRRPLWEWPDADTCLPSESPLRLEPGETQLLQVSIPSAVVARGGRSIEEYYLMAVVDVDGEPIRFGVDPT